MNRSEIIKDADSKINGDRAKDYGEAFENHERIAEGWNIIMKNALKTHGYLTVSHVALMMDWLKTARLLHSIDHADTWVDKVGYAALGGEMALKDDFTQD